MRTLPRQSASSSAVPLSPPVTPCCWRKRSTSRWKIARCAGRRGQCEADERRPCETGPVTTTAMSGPATAWQVEPLLPVRFPLLPGRSVQSPPSGLTGRRALAFLSGPGHQTKRGDLPSVTAKFVGAARRPPTSRPDLMETFAVFDPNQGDVFMPPSPQPQRWRKEGKMLREFDSIKSSTRRLLLL